MYVFVVVQTVKKVRLAVEAVSVLVRETGALLDDV